MSLPGSSNLFKPRLSSLDPARCILFGVRHAAFTDPPKRKGIQGVADAPGFDEIGPDEVMFGVSPKVIQKNCRGNPRHCWWPGWA